VNRLVVAFPTGGFALRDAGTLMAITGDYLLSVSTFDRSKHLSLFSPTGDPSKPGTGTTLLFYGGNYCAPGNYVRPPGPVFDATKPSFHPEPS
jgi:hypothetical protein